MQLTDDQVVKILIAKYKRAGIDLAYVIHDPVFNSLPLSSKIDALKQNAEELSKGTSGKFKYSDLSPIGITAGFGALSGYLSVPKILADSARSGLLSKSNNTLARRMLGSKTMFSTRALGAIGGALVGAGGAFLDNQQKRSGRYQMKSTLSSLAKNPTDENAVYGLSSLQSQRPNSLFLNRLSGLFQERLSESNRELIPKTYLDEIKEIKHFRDLKKS